MAIQAPYKKFKRGQRMANVETDFRSGMMYTEGTVSEGYVKTLVNFDFTTDGRDALKPRAALVTREIIVPDINAEWEDPSDKAEFLDDDVTLKHVKECTMDGKEYRQIILGKPDIVDGEILDVGKLWVVTSERNIDDFNDLRLAGSVVTTVPASCAFHNVGLAEIHKCKLTPNAKTSLPIGAFLGDSFYFFDTAGNGSLQKTEFINDLEEVTSPRFLFYENPDPLKSGLDPKSVSASEAVNYGYNMLSHTPYEFDDDSTGSTPIIMEGILPYSSSDTTELMMTPKANSRVWFRCNYKLPVNNSYKIKWSWKEVSGTDDWTVFSEKNLSWSSVTTDPVTGEYVFPKIVADLIVPSKEILVRCEAYNTSQSSTVERAMTVGFDFSLDPESTTRNSAPDTFDLSTATGMISWKNRLVLWGVPKDPTILFISDLDEPTYFPYPNNVTIFDEPIIAVTELMDNLVVFTKSKVHQVSLNTDGTSWTDTIIQSNLYIEPWDKHLIQPVRNMVYFKSGNYYYMIVPKAQSTTGELTLAPITTPITDFFNHFSTNVIKLFKDCFKYNDDQENLCEPYPNELRTYYNFVDYENIHNFYVYTYENTPDSYVYVHFDIIYNTVDRYWKINVYESPHFLFPFRNDATQQGILSGTSLMRVTNTDTSEETDERFIQLFGFDSLTVEDLYIPEGTSLKYSESYIDTYVDDGVLEPVEDVASVDDEILSVNSNYIRAVSLDFEILEILSNRDLVNGFNRRQVKDEMDRVVKGLADITTFPNKQMLDTGYRDANPFINKRYRELQLQINNIDNVDMEFGMDFHIAGEPRNTDFMYEVSQVIDEMKQDEGIAYIDATPYLPIPWVDGEERKGEIDKTNLWTLEHSTDNPDISLWKVRASVSGKGVAPRLRLFTKNMFNYQLLGVNWIYREMNMR